MGDKHQHEVDAVGAYEILVGFVAQFGYVFLYRGYVRFGKCLAAVVVGGVEHAEVRLY